MYDIVFCSLPIVWIDQIYSAPATLKGVVNFAGFNARTYDFGMELYKKCDQDANKFTQVQKYFISSNKTLAIEDQIILDQWYDHVIDTLVNVNTRYIGLSVFSLWTHKATLEILLRLKQLGLTHKVVLGGRGLKTGIHDSIIDRLPNPNINDKIQWFGDVLKSKQLVEHVVIGDGEDAIVEFLTTNSLSQKVYTTQGFDFPMADYEDYNFDDYLWVGQPSLQIKSSQGCVRNCDFCDIKVQFGNYQFKDGNQLAEEMIHLQNKFGINKFTLVDSLSNGSMKHFNQFITRLSEHNQLVNDPIVWNGQYICRDNRHTANIDEYYRKLKLSGAEGLTIGAESGSNHVLKAMNKKSSVEALFFELEKFKQNNIVCSLLTFCGHWSERPQDFVDHCNMLINLVPYAVHGTLSGIILGGPAEILHGTPAWHNSNVIKHKLYYGNLWVDESNPGNTLKVRTQRRMVIHKLAKLLNLPMLSEGEFLHEFANFSLNRINEINSFYTIYSSSTSDHIQDIDKFIYNLFDYKTVNLKLEVEANSTSSDPNFLLCINQTVLYDGLLSQGSHVLEYTVPADGNNTLSMTLTNKSPTDTELDSMGAIVKDKNIKIKSLSINNLSITDNPAHYYKFFSSDGLYFNDQSLTLCFSMPFVLWYSANVVSDSHWHQTDLRNNAQTIVSEEEAYLRLESVLDKLQV
jgi:hypothetical protein